MPSRFMCLSSYKKDGEEVWTKGKIYCALMDVGDSWSVETNDGGLIQIGERFPLNKPEDIFLDLYFTNAQKEREARLEKENKLLALVYRDTIEAHGNEDNMVDIEISENSFREFVAKKNTGMSFEEYLNEYIAPDNDGLVEFLKERNEFVLPIECAIRQEVEDMILETNKYAMPENRLSREEMNQHYTEHGWEDISLVHKVVSERLSQYFNAPDAVKSDLRKRLVLCFAGKFDELEKYKKKHQTMSIEAFR